MPRPATGSPRWNATEGYWEARVTMPGKKDREPPIPMKGIARDDNDGARRMAKLISDRMRNGGHVPLGTGETVNEYAKRWLDAREGRIASVRDNRGHLNEHILPVIGTYEIALVARKEIEDLVGALDRKVRAGEMSAKTARNVWGTCSKLFDDAANAKPGEGLRCIASDPTNGVRGPDDDEADKLLQFLYPSEFAAFVTCERVPLAWRRNAAIATYLYLRDGEQRALKWTAIDLAHALVTIEETYDRRTRADRDGTKTGGARAVPIRPELLPLLQVMHAEAKKAAKGAEPTGYVCKLPSERDMARGLRRWLLKAGVTRPQLHKTTSASKQIRWHDLRATGATWLAVEGRSAPEIRDLLGHTQTTMTDHCMRNAAILRGGRFGEPFPALPASLLRSDSQRPDPSNSGASHATPAIDDAAISSIDPVVAHAAMARSSRVFESRPPRSRS